MIQGEFDEEGKLIFGVDLIDIDGEPIEVNAVLDTGFTDWLAVNTQDAETLGWLLLNSNQLMQTAHSKAKFRIYAGKIRLGGQEYEIPALGGETLSEILLGLPWLRTRRLVVDYQSGVLTLG